MHGSSIHKDLAPVCHINHSLHRLQDNPLIDHPGAAAIWRAALVLYNTYISLSLDS